MARNKLPKCPHTRRRFIAIEALMSKAHIDRTTALRVMKVFDDSQLGEFVKGVRGYASRLEMI